MAKRVLITEPIIPAVIDKLKERYEVDIGERGTYNKEEALVDDIAEYDALLPMLSNPITEQVIDAAKNLKIIANHAVGYNNIDMKAAHDAGIYVANTPDVLTDSCADFTIALLLAVGRRLFEAQEYLFEGKFDGWDPLGFLGLELKGSTLGIIGMGRIGTAVAKRAEAFDMNIIYHNRSRVSPDIENKLGASYFSSVTELAKKSDVLSIHCPLTEDTKKLIDAEILSKMKSDAIILNTARGPVVDEEALANALHNNIIGGAGLDVFEEEPEVHPDLKDAPNCVLTPHIASATHNTRKAIGMLAADAIIGVLEHRPESAIPNLIQP